MHVIICISYILVSVHCQNVSFNICYTQYKPSIEVWSKDERYLPVRVQRQALHHDHRETNNSNIEPGQTQGPTSKEIKLNF